MTQPDASLFPHGIAGAIQNLADPEKISGEAYSYTESVVRVLGAWRLITLFRDDIVPAAPADYDFWIKPAELVGTVIVPPEMLAYDPNGGGVGVAAWVTPTPGHLLGNLMRSADDEGVVLPGMPSYEHGPTASLPGIDERTLGSWYGDDDTDKHYQLRHDGANPNWVQV